MDAEKAASVATLTQELSIVSISLGTMQEKEDANIPEQAVQDLVVTKQTLFYIQHAKLYPIFTPQPPRPQEILIHVVRHAEVCSKSAATRLRFPAL